MTAPDGMNYPPDMVPIMEKFIRTAGVQLGLADETSAIANEVKNATVSAAFDNFHMKATDLVNRMRATMETAQSLGGRTIQAHGDMMSTDRRAASLFEV
jgi:hypothetical protein